MDPGNQLECFSQMHSSAGSPLVEFSLPDQDAKPVPPPTEPLHTKHSLDSDVVIPTEPLDTKHSDAVVVVPTESLDTKHSSLVVPTKPLNTKHSDVPMKKKQKQEDSLIQTGNKPVPLMDPDGIENVYMFLSDSMHIWLTNETFLDRTLAIAIAHGISQHMQFHKDPSVWKGRDTLLLPCEDDCKHKCFVFVPGVVSAVYTNGRWTLPVWLLVMVQHKWLKRLDELCVYAKYFHTSRMSIARELKLHNRRRPSDTIKHDMEHEPAKAIPLRFLERMRMIASQRGHESMKRGELFIQMGLAFGSTTCLKRYLLASPSLLATPSSLVNPLANPRS